MGGERFFEPTNCYTFQTVFTILFDGVMSSTIGNLEAFLYEDGRCDLADGTLHLWSENGVDTCWAIFGSPVLESLL